MTLNLLSQTATTNILPSSPHSHFFGINTSDALELPTFDLQSFDVKSHIEKGNEKFKLAPKSI